VIPRARPGLALLLLGCAGILWTPLPLSPQLSQGVGGIEGRVVTEVGEVPISGALVRIRGIARTDVTHAEGRFHLENVPAGRHTLDIQMLGYAPGEVVLELLPGERLQVQVVLRVSALTLTGIVVTGVGMERGIEESYRPTTVLAQEALDRRLSGSLAATLRNQPGIATQSFGPAPAQPMIRGMGGDRVLVLEDGGRTGDLYATGADHAVGIDPISAGRIEVVRGPAGLLYGSNALGGVINVIREEVPRGMPGELQGSAGAQWESMNQGVTAGATALVPLGFRWAGRAELTARRGQDLQTPLGVLSGTDSQSEGGALGLSWLPNWGFLGGSYRVYRLDYGLPSEFQGAQIPGAHAGGARAESIRHAARIQFGHFLGLGPFSLVQGDGSVVRYLHREVEGSGAAGARVIGTSFDQLSATFNLVGRHEHTLGGLREEGAIGLYGVFQDLLTGGSFPGVRDSRSRGVALFAYEELHHGRARLQFGGRYDLSEIEPLDLRPIDRGDRLIEVRTRPFQDVSASLALLFDPADGWVIGASLARAFRAPSVRELFSAGPHLADFAYDIGNPELGTEVGLGVDLFLRWTGSRVHLEASLFENRIRDFIHSRPAGTLDPRFRRFPVFMAESANALFRGGEGRFQAELIEGLVLEGMVSHVQAELTAGGEPLPRIPPTSGALALRYELPGWFVLAEWERTGAQRRVAPPIPSPVPGELDLIPERPTAGYDLLALGGGVRMTLRGRVHSLTLNVQNVLDRAWWDHLSRAKEVAPEPGRNVQLLYRIAY